MAGQTYFVKVATANTFRLAAGPGGADINTSGSQSGTQTAVYSPYGIGDGATTFEVPDLRGRAPFGIDNLGGASPANRVTYAGSAIGATTPAASGGSQYMQSHTHGLQTRSDLSSAGGGVTAVYMGGGGSTSTQATGSGNSQNMPPTLITGYIIKY